MVSMEPTTAANASTWLPPACLLSGMGWNAAGAEDPYGAVSSEISDSLEKGDLPARNSKPGQARSSRTAAYHSRQHSLFRANPLLTSTCDNKNISLQNESQAAVTHPRSWAQSTGHPYSLPTVHLTGRRFVCSDDWSLSQPEICDRSVSPDSAGSLVIRQCSLLCRLEGPEPQPRPLHAQRCQVESPVQRCAGCEQRVSQ